MSFRLLLLAVLMPAVVLAEEPKRSPLRADGASLAPQERSDWELIGEKQSLLHEKPGLGGPVGLTFGGLASLGLGVAALWVTNGSQQPGGDSARAGSVALVALGAATLTAGIAWWIKRGLARLGADREVTALNTEFVRRGLRTAESEDPTYESASASPGLSSQQVLGLLGVVALLGLMALGAGVAGGGPH